MSTNVQSDDEIHTAGVGVEPCTGVASICLTTSIPSMMLPKTTCYKRNMLENDV